MIPFSFPFHNKKISLNISGNLIDVNFQTSKRDEIIKQYFPKLPFELYINKKKLPTSQAEISKWIDNDRFGQLNYMYATYYFFITEKNIDDIKKTLDVKYLPLCAEVINHISKAYRLLIDQYFPRNFTKNDFIGYLIAFSSDKNDFFGEEYHNNVVFHQDYPDKNLRIDINDFLRYEKDIKLHTELILNSEDFFMEKNYRMTVIEADTAIESILSNIIIKHYNKFPKDTQNEAFLNKILEMRLDDFKKYLKHVSPNITSLTEWAKWREKCHTPRNEVVHKRKMPEEKEAEDALASAKKLLEVLKDFLYEEVDWILEATAFINDREKAKCYLEKSLAKNPHPDAYYYLGHIECEDKNYGIAIQHYKEGLKLISDPFYKPHFYFFMGKCYEDQGLHNDAIKEYDESIRLIDQFDRTKLNSLIRHPHHNPYYRKYLIIKEQKLKHDSKSMVKLFNSLLERFYNHPEFLKLRDDFSKST